MRLQHLLRIGGGGLAAIIIGALVAPSHVYDRFIWQYFWGPIVADGAGVHTVTRNGIEAVAGYNLVNEIGYGLLLVYALLLVVGILRRQGVGDEHSFAAYFVPFVVSGGLLRVVEDAVSQGALQLAVPWRYLFISPLIYVTMFAVVLTALIFSLWLQRRGRVTDYRQVILVLGGIMAAALTLFLIALDFTQMDGMLRWWMFAASLGGAGLLTAGTWYVARQFLATVPHLAGILRPDGLAILFGQLLDGVSTAISLELLSYGEKHPVVVAFVDWAGSAYPFILLKLVVAVGILALLHDDVREEDPRTYNLFLLGILAIGLGPGIRNMMRAVLGI